MILMTGEELSKTINTELKQQVKGYMIKPCVAVIQIGENVICNWCIKEKIKASEEVGIYLKHIYFPDDTREIEIINKIVELNNDDYVNGIVIELPIPNKYNRERLINYIARNKDVAGITDLSLGKIFNGKKAYIPCVAQSVVSLCDYYNIELEGKNVVIINRSSVIGKPLIGLLLNRDATVTVCHSKTSNIEKKLKTADIIITAVGKYNLINKNMVKDDAIIFDIGLSMVDDKLCGDVNLKDFDKSNIMINSIEKCITLVASSILMKNVVESYQKMNEER